MALTGETQKSPALAKAILEFTYRRRAKEFGRLIRESAFDYPDPSAGGRIPPTPCRRSRRFESWFSWIPPPGSRRCGGNGDLRVKLAVEGLLDAYEAQWCTPVRLEVLGGARKEERSRLGRHFSVIPYRPVREDDWERAPSRWHGGCAMEVSPCHGSTSSSRRWPCRTMCGSTRSMRIFPKSPGAPVEALRTRIRRGFCSGALTGVRRFLCLFSRRTCGLDEEPVFGAQQRPCIENSRSFSASSPCSLLRPGRRNPSSTARTSPAGRVCPSSGR